MLPSAFDLFVDVHNKFSISHSLELIFWFLSKLPKLEIVFETHASMKVQERRNKFFLLLMPKDKRKGMRAENGLA